MDKQPPPPPPSMCDTSNCVTFDHNLPQVITVRKRSCGKVMFLHLSVILFIGGVSASVHTGIHPPGKHPPMPSARWDRHGYCCGRYASY